MCDNCQTTVGPFYIAYTPQVGRSFRVCGPVKFEKETAKLIGRVVDCAERRKKLEKEWYGAEDYRS